MSQLVSAGGGVNAAVGLGVVWLNTLEFYAMALSDFQLGKLKIAAHVREELDRIGIAAESIQCLSDGVHLPLRSTRLTIAVGGTLAHLDLMTHEVEDCAVIVAGEPWRKIAALIGKLPRPK
jgi:hypothetical protein